MYISRFFKERDDPLINTNNCVIITFVSTTYFLNPFFPYFTVRKEKLLIPNIFQIQLSWSSLQQLKTEQAHEKKLHFISALSFSQL